MAKTIHEFIATLPPEEQESIKEGYKELWAEYMAMQEIRKAMALTQEEVAKRLHIAQSSLSRLEKRNDLLISTLRKFIEAMGGRLHITVTFPDRPPVEISGFSEVAETTSLDDQVIL